MRNPLATESPCSPAKATFARSLPDDHRIHVRRSAVLPAHLLHGPGRTIEQPQVHAAKAARPVGGEVDVRTVKADRGIAVGRGRIRGQRHKLAGTPIEQVEVVVADPTGAVRGEAHPGPLPEMDGSMSAPSEAVAGMAD